MIHDLLQDYAAKKRSEGKSENTISRVVTDVGAFARDMEIDTPDQITNALVEEWGDLKRRGIFTQSGLPISESSLYAYYNSLRSFLTHLEDVHVDFPTNRKTIRCKPNYTRMVVLRASDVAKIARCAHSYEINVLIRLLYCTGMRLSEGLDVKPTNLKHDNTIWVNGKWCVSRHVILWPELRQELWNLAPDGGYCFAQKYLDENVPISRRNAYTNIKRAMIKAAEKYKNPLYAQAYPHSLRHTNATEQLRGGASLEHVARQLGHTKLETTRRYLHLITEDIILSHAQSLPRV